MRRAFIRRRQNFGISLPVYVLVIVFGSCSWLSVNSVFLEMPLMVNDLPEGWGLPSYLAVITQLGIVGPILFAIFKKLSSETFDPARLIATMISFGCISTILLVFFWDKQAFIAGESRSVALFVLFFCLALVNCTSNVVFLPYMAAFKPPYMTAYFIGMGLSGLVPSLVSLIQGSGRTECLENNGTVVANHLAPNFSVAVFNGIMFLWMLFALLAFCLLNWHPVVRRERVGYVDEKEKANGYESASVGDDESTNRSYTEEKSANETNAALVEIAEPPNVLALPVYLFLLLLTAWVCALMNGILPSIQSFACMPYGEMTYHLSVAFANIANPIACFVPFFVQLKRPIPVVSGLTGLASAISGYLIFLAAKSPESFLLHSVGGPILCVIAWILTFAVLAYLRTVMAGVLREAAGNSELRLFWCGMLTQAGSFVGAVIMFPLVNVLRLFQQAKPCSVGLGPY